MPRRAKLVRLRKPKVDPDSEFIRTLVWVLDQARAGKVFAYAMVFDVEDDEKGNCRLIEAADVQDPRDLVRILGGIRYMEHNLIQRERGV